MTTPTHVEAWDSIPRDLDVYDRSRFRGDTPAPDRAEAERTVNLGNGMTQVTYIDSPPPPEG